MIAIEEGDFPLVAVHLTGASTDAEVRTCLERLETLLHSDAGPYALIIDVREAELPTIGQLRTTAASVRANEGAAVVKLAGVAFVTENVTTMAAVHALFDLAPTGVPWTIEGRLSKARAWARAQLSETRA